MTQKRLDKAKRKLNLLDFDELNVLQETETLYAGIEEDCKTAFRALYIARYEELWMYLKDKKPDEDMLDDLVDMYLAGLFDEPHPVTHYAFDTETIRKRDKAKEAIISVPTKLQKQIELDKSVRYMVQQYGWYTDFVSQDAEIQAYKDAGVKKLKRHEMNDDRVCATCRAANGKIYEINKIPPLDHLRCRRWFTAAK